MVVRAVGAKGSLLARGWRSVVQLTCAQSGLEGLRSTDEPPGRPALLPPRTCKRWQNPPCLPEDSLRSRSAARRLGPPGFSSDHPEDKWLLGTDAVHSENQRR